MHQGESNNLATQGTCCTNHLFLLLLFLFQYPAFLLSLKYVWVQQLFALVLHPVQCTNNISNSILIRDLPWCAASALWLVLLSIHLSDHFSVCHCTFNLSVCKCLSSHLHAARWSVLYWSPHICSLVSVSISVIRDNFTCSLSNWTHMISNALQNRIRLSTALLHLNCQKQSHCRKSTIDAE